MAQQQELQPQPIVRSPTSTLADEEATMNAEAVNLAAAYRARIAASPAPGAPHSQFIHRSTPAARLLTFVNSSPLPTPTVHGSDQQSVQVLEKKWKTMYGVMRSNSQAAADVLMKQAQATSQLEEMVQLLFTQLKAGAEERVRLQQLLLAERAQLMAAAEEAQQLHTRLHTSEHRSTAVQVVTETLQSQLSQAREALEASGRERQQLAEQVKQLAEQLSVTSECRTRGDKLIAEQAAVIDTLRTQLQDQASTASSLAEDKAQLEAQLQGVLQAEQELTVHLRETHAAIEGQLAALRDQLKMERQKRAAVVKRRGELQAQVEQLQAQLAAQRAEMAALLENASAAQHARTPQHAQARVANVVPASHAAPTASVKPTGHSGAPSRTTASMGIGHAATSRPATASGGGANSAAVSHSIAAAGGTGVVGRARGLVRSTGGAVGSSRPQASSPLASASRSGVGRASAVRRRSVSPSASPGAEPPEADGGQTASPPDRGEASPEAFAAFRIPSSLSQPIISFTTGSPTGQEGPDPDRDTGTAWAAKRPGGLGGPDASAATDGGGSPSGSQALNSAREGGRLHAAGHNASSSGGRRRSLSPGPSRTSLNATQYTRRASPAPATARAASPGSGAAGAWLP